MRFLANENFPLDAVVALRQLGHDVAWIRTDAPGICDQEVLKRAVTEERILPTFDKDFGELAFRSKLPAVLVLSFFELLHLLLRLLLVSSSQQYKQIQNGRDISL